MLPPLCSILSPWNPEQRAGDLWLQRLVSFGFRFHGTHLKRTGLGVEKAAVGRELVIL